MPQTGVSSQQPKQFRLTANSFYGCKVTVNVAFTQQPSKSFEIVKGSRTINTDVPVWGGGNQVQDISVTAPPGCTPLNGNEWTGPSPMPNANVQISADGSTNIKVTN
jgi:hypothetical protein